jgi:hypothetical protein
MMGQRTIGIREARIAKLDPDAPHDVPYSLRPRVGVEVGCGVWTCTDCYEPDIDDDEIRDDGGRVAR